MATKSGFTSVHMISGDRQSIMFRARQSEEFDFDRIRDDTWRFYKQHVEENKLECFYLLKNAGADLNARTVHGETPLMTAILCCYGNMVKLLLSEGASIDDKLNPQVAPPYCDTMLGMALGCQCFESARILFDAGACDVVLDHLNEVETVVNRRRKHGELTSQAFADYTAQMQAERPRKLGVLARKVIRSRLGTNVKRDIELTGLPSSMQDFVLMKDQLITSEQFVNRAR